MDESKATDIASRFLSQHLNVTFQKAFLKDNVWCVTFSAQIINRERAITVEIDANTGRICRYSSYNQANTPKVLS